MELYYIIIFYCVSLVAAQQIFNKLRRPDFKEEECYAEKWDFHYFGDKNNSVDRLPCERWIDVTRWVKRNFGTFQLYFFADEFTEHNHCRNINLTSYTQHIKTSNASAHLFLGYADEFQKGPWCFVKKSGSMPVHMTAMWEGYYLTEEGGAKRSYKHFDNEKIDLQFEPMHCFKSCD